MLIPWREYVVISMVKNMRNCDKLKSKMKEIFNSLEIEYSILEFSDDDLNYEIQVSTIGKLKPLNSITCILYLCEFDMSINLIVGNIYRVYDESDLLSLYRIINSINMSINNGNFILSDDSPKQIIYKSSVNCGDDFAELDDELVIFQINIFVGALERLLDLLKGNVLQRPYEKTK